MNKVPSVILGWPTRFEAKREAEANRINPLMQKQKRLQKDLAHSVQYGGDGHLVTFAPTGSGKGVSVIIPNLLHYNGPTIVIDPKGENFAVTARFRKSLGHRILLLDPFRKVPPELLSKEGVDRGRLNPLDLVSLSDTSVENDAQMIASMLAGDGNLGSEPFWDIAAKSLLSGLIAHEMQVAQRAERSPSFRKVVADLFDDDPRYHMAAMLQDEKPSTFVKQTVGSGFAYNDSEKTRDSILATAQSYLAPLMSVDLLGFLESSTINLRNIQVDGDYTLYIVIPPTKLESHSVLLKLWVGVLMHAVMERTEMPLFRTLFVLDECANLGRMSVLRKAVTLLRGYGLQVWMFFQDLSQMEELFGTQSRTMINNCGVLQAFGISRMASALPLASVIGKYDDKDILRLDRTQQILSFAPGDVRIARLLKYHRDFAFAGQFDRNPLIREAKPPIEPRSHYLVADR